MRVRAAIIQYDAGGLVLQAASAMVEYPVSREAAVSVIRSMWLSAAAMVEVLTNADNCYRITERPV